MCDHQTAQFLLSLSLSLSLSFLYPLFKANRTCFSQSEYASVRVSALGLLLCLRASFVPNCGFRVQEILVHSHAVVMDGHEVVFRFWTSLLEGD
jgi:hypothetical protein